MPYSNHFKFSLQCCCLLSNSKAVNYSCERRAEKDMKFKMETKNSMLMAKCLILTIQMNLVKVALNLPAMSLYFAVNQLSWPLIITSLVSHLFALGCDLFLWFDLDMCFFLMYSMYIVCIYYSISI